MSQFNPEAPGFQPAPNPLNPAASGYEPAAITPSPIVSAHQTTFPEFHRSDFRGKPVDGTKYQILELKAQSFFSSRIYVCFDLSRRKRRALKAISDRDRQTGTQLTSDRQEVRVKHEIKMHRRVHGHRNICTLNGWLQYSPVGHLLMELCKKDLHDLVRISRATTSRFNIKKLFLDIVDGVIHCHQRNVAHRNLNPHNIGIIFDDEYEEDDAVLLDFGAAISPLESTDPIHLEINGYDAPEMHLMRPPSAGVYDWAAGDIWSLGVILFHMMTGEEPFEDYINRCPHYEKYKKGKRLQDRFPEISEELEAILRDVFTHDPSNRLPLKELRLRVFRCENFYFPKYQKYPYWTGRPSRRDQKFMKNQRPDKEDDVHDDFYKDEKDPPWSAPAQLTRPAQPSAMPDRNTFAANMPAQNIPAQSTGPQNGFVLNPNMGNMGLPGYGGVFPYPGGYL